MLISVYYLFSIRVHSVHVIFQTWSIYHRINQSNVLDGEESVQYSSERTASARKAFNIQVVELLVRGKHSIFEWANCKCEESIQYSSGRTASARKAFNIQVGELQMRGKHSIFEWANCKCEESIQYSSGRTASARKAFNIQVGELQVRGKHSIFKWANCKCEESIQYSSGQTASALFADKLLIEMYHECSLKTAKIINNMPHNISRSCASPIPQINTLRMLLHTMITSSYH
ncbi:hypothetical protein DPMN_017048 [Dreissena polymorpha]|uniref:Uncharacterized protein n=1 Tax=Dreissena polymorpha TaxID=45954 RepID=A0A9D4NAR6_DREPO|nr:hypothetical protein DPMN_017048 [Dreissena polymorpha]